VNILAGGVTLETYGGYMVPATCLFADAATGGCWTPVVAKRAGNSQFVVRAYATASVGDVLAGYLIEGWAAMDLFGPVVGDLALVPSY
jgi:hypothetical protein